MGWFDNIKTKFNSKNSKHAKMMSGQTPVFSQFGNDIYVSDIMQQCMGCITEEMKKLRLHHVIEKNGKETIAESKLNRLFGYGVNEYMTTSDFLEKTTYMLLKNSNAYIYPKISVYEDANGNVKKREVEGFYPLDPTRVEFFQDETGRLFIKMYFKGCDPFMLPYDNIIHWRMRFTENEYLGGNYQGKPEIDDLLQTVQINDRLLQGVDQAMQKGLAMNGLMKYPVTDEDDIKKDIEKFEKKLQNNESGIMPLSAKSEYIPLKFDPKLIDKDTLEFIDNKILRHWGCSIPMLNGTATPSEKMAFYEKTLENKVISLSQVMTKTVFTPIEYSNGNRIKAYPGELVFLNTTEKLTFAQFMGDRGAMTNNQLLNIFGMPPYEGGDVRYMSLNYCDVDIANQYQLNRAGAYKGGEQSGNKE
ncbi:MAG: phage portal protein [Lentihominibacter sp.]